MSTQVFSPASLEIARKLWLDQAMSDEKVLNAIVILARVRAKLPALADEVEMLLRAAAKVGLNP